MTKERDPLLAAVVETVRAEDRDALSDPRWEDLARGELSEEERAELEALAGGDPLAAEAPALFTPFDAATREGFFEAARAQLQEAPARGDAAKGEATARVDAAKGEATARVDAAKGDATARGDAAKGDAAKGEAERASNVVSIDERRGRRRALVAAIGVAAALAAGVALRLGMDPSGEAALPTYALAVSGGERDVRADSSKVVLSPGSRVVLTLRPATAADGSVSARGFLVQPPHEIELPGVVVTSADGAVRLTAQVPERAALAGGAAEIVVVIGRPDLLGGGPTSVDALSKHGGSVRWARANVEYLPR